MNYIVVQLCCTDCMHFEGLYIINADNYTELRKILKSSFDSDYDYMIYDYNGNFLNYF